MQTGAGNLIPLAGASQVELFHSVKRILRPG
jgi:hypothetical protein